jgi:hypothetical protein
MANLAGNLTCPECQNKNQFTIHATVEVHVQGSNYLSPYAQGALSYGSLSLCVCATCKHADKLDAFVTGVVTLEQYVDDELGPRPEDKAGAAVHPIRPGLR